MRDAIKKKNTSALRDIFLLRTKVSFFEFEEGEYAVGVLRVRVKQKNKSVLLSTIGGERVFC